MYYKFSNKGRTDTLPMIVKPFKLKINLKFIDVHQI